MIRPDDSYDEMPVRLYLAAEMMKSPYLFNVCEVPDGKGGTFPHRRVNTRGLTFNDLVTCAFQVADAMIVRANAARRAPMASDGGPAYPFTRNQTFAPGISVRDAFAMAVAAQYIIDSNTPMDDSRAIYDFAQALTDEKLRRDRADRDKGLDFLDIPGGDIKLGVQVEIRDDGKVLWVSVDGVTVLRISQIPALELDDCRDEGKAG